MSPDLSPDLSPDSSAAPSPALPPRLGWRRLLAHALHVPLLLLPTLVLQGLAGLDVSTLCFVGGIATAAVLESRFVRQRFEIAFARVHDRTAVRMAQVVGIGLLVVFWSAQVEGIFLPTRWSGLPLAGAVLLGLGITLRILAIRALGTQFVSDVRVGGRVVRNGVYAWLKHPSEIGLLLIAGGGPLLLDAPVSAVAAAVLLLPVSRWRMRREDQALAASAGAPRSGTGKV